MYAFAYKDIHSREVQLMLHTSEAAELFLNLCLITELMIFPPYRTAFPFLGHVGFLLLVNFIVELNVSFPDPFSFVLRSSFC